MTYAPEFTVPSFCLDRRLNCSAIAASCRSRRGNIRSRLGNNGHCWILARDASVAIDPQRHFAIINCRIAKGLFDYLIGSREQRRRHVEAERLGGLEVEH